MTDTPTPKFVSILDWTRLTGQSRTSTYNALGQGHLRAKKLGKLTFIDFSHGMAWFESLPDAKFGTSA